MYVVCMWVVGMWYVPLTVWKTVRTRRKTVNTKIYVDLSGYIEEESIYNGFHYYISEVTTEDYSYVNDVEADWFTSKKIHLVKTEAGQHFRNGHVECRYRMWKGMTRLMID